MIQSSRLKSARNGLLKWWEQHAQAIVLCPILMLMVYSLGFRPEQWGSDTTAYMAMFRSLIERPDSFPHYEWLFVVFLKWMNRLSHNPGVFFSFLIFFNITMLTVNASLLSQYLWGASDRYRYIVLLYLVSFISPFFLSAQINVIRQGAALSFIILFYLILLNRYSLFWLLILAIIAQGFHSTSILFILPAFGLFFSYKSIVRFLAFLIGLYGTGITPYIVQKVSILTGIGFYDKIINYGAKASYVKGVRYSFLLFTLGMGIAFDCYGRYFRQEASKKDYFGVLKIYWLLSIPFWLIGFGAYSDRFLLPCWTFLSYMSAILLKSVDEALKTSILFWLFLVYAIASGYFFYHYMQ